MADVKNEGFSFSKICLSIDSKYYLSDPLLLMFDNHFLQVKRLGDVMIENTS